jgi:hypothetical protein
MSDAARVTSIDAVKDFHAALCQFCEEAKEALCSIDMESRRVFDWVVHDQLGRWKKAILDRQEEVAQAKADLFRRQLARISGQHPDCIEQKEAVWEAQRRVEEAEEKVEKCRHWGRLLQRALEEYAAPAQQLANLVEGKPPHAVLFLDDIIARLDSYVGLAPFSIGEPSTQTTSPASSAATTTEKP